jgi:hypothetical protein
MVSTRKKRGKPNSPNGKKSSPRRGAKSKQTKLTPAKEAETKVSRQTTLAFSTPSTAESSKNTASNTSQPPMVTPEARSANRLAHPTPPPTPERQEITSPSKESLTTYAEKVSANDKKPAAKTTTTTTTTNTPIINTVQPTSNNTEQEKPNKQHTKTVKKVRHADTNETPQATTKTSQDDTASPPPVPLALQKPSKTYQAIRYNGFVEVPPSEKPFQDFLLAMKEYLKIIQEVLGKDVFIAAWDSEQEKAFPPIKRPEKIPSTRESLGIYLGTYVNPKQDGSTVYLNLRLITFKKNPVPMDRFGTELADGFANSKFDITIRRNPRACQAAKSECIGWLMYSSKSMNSNTFVPALKLALKIPDDVEVGIQYRTIANEQGKKPPFDKENPPAAAIHLDIDERYALLYQARAASLWRKNSNKRLPNGVQLRLVPCFTSATGKSMTDTQCSDAKTLLERQYYFVKEHLRVLPAYFFISQLDTPLAPDKPMTLRRAMMSKAPANRPSCRLIHNVDASWNQPSKHTITSVVGREREAQRFLVNMIPEFLYQFGQEASKWFTGEALLVYKEVTWNPKNGKTSSAKERNSEEMVQEDLWELSDKWDKINVTTTTTDRPDATALDGTKPTTTTEPPTITKPTPTTTEPNQEHQRLASDKSIASFGNVYQRTRDEDDDKEDAAQAQEAAAMEVDQTGTQFEFSPEQLEQDRLKTLAGPMSTGFSMSTAGKTTGTTRLALKEAKEELKQLKLELAKQLQSKSKSSKTSNSDSPEATPETTLAGDMQLDNDEDASLHREEFTETQALSAAIHRKKEFASHDKDDLKDNGTEPIQIGGSDSDDYDPSVESAPTTPMSTPERNGPKTPDREGSLKAKPIAIGSSESESSSSSSESSSSSDSATSESTSSDETAGTHDTAELVAKLIQATPPKLHDTPTTYLADTGYSDETVTSQTIEPRSESEQAHQPPPHSHGIAGNLPEAAGPRV